MENIVMKKLLIATALATSLTTVSVQASPRIMQDDMNQIFSIGSTGGSFPVGAGKQSHQVAMLSSQEMKETEGEWINWAVGAAFGAGGYAWGYYRGNYAWNNARFAGNVASGALIGGTFGAAGAIASGGARGLASYTNLGSNVWRFNAAAANTGVNFGWRR
jgi:hypothetical protein